MGHSGSNCHSQSSVNHFMLAIMTLWGRVTYSYIYHVVVIYFSIDVSLLRRYYVISLTYPLNNHDVFKETNYNSTEAFSCCFVSHEPCTINPWYVHLLFSTISVEGTISFLLNSKDPWHACFQCSIFIFVRSPLKLSWIST